MSFDINLSIMVKLSKKYVELEVIPRFRDYFADRNMKFSYANVAAELGGLSKSTVSKIVVDYWVSESNLRMMYLIFGIQEYETWDRTHNLNTWALDQIAESHWVSYRFNSTRQLYVSSWIFTKDKNKLVIWKKAPGGLQFKGEMSLNENYCLQGSMSKGVINLNYNTVLPIQEMQDHAEFTGRALDLSTAPKFNWLVFNLLVRHGDEIYATVEVLHRNQPAEQLEHDTHNVIEKKLTAIKADFDATGHPQNPEYLAYNFLTHYNTKSRVPVNNRSGKMGASLNYRHTIRVACPVRSLGDKNTFDLFRETAGNLEQTLVDKFKFKPEDIYFEITNYKEWKHVDRESNYLFERQQTINYTHFIAIIPQGAKISTGVFAEIFYRIGRKLPIVIFYEGEKSLKGILGNLKNNGQIINTKFRKYQELDEVVEKLSVEGESLFSYELL